MDAALGGPARDGLRLNVRHDWWDCSQKSSFRVGLYIQASVFENSVDSLDVMLDHFEASPWYPVATAPTLEEAFAKLAKKLDDADLYPTQVDGSNWFGLVFCAAFQFTQLEDKDQRYAFNYDDTKIYIPLNEHGNVKETNQGCTQAPDQPGGYIYSS